MDCVVDNEELVVDVLPVAVVNVCVWLACVLVVPEINGALSLVSVLFTGVPADMFIKISGVPDTKVPVFALAQIPSCPEMLVCPINA